MTNNSSRISLGLTVAICCALGAAGAVFAQVPSRGPMTFDAFDQNANGAVTEQEFNAARAERMAARAAQGAPMRGAASAPAFADFDLNGDGQMTADEFAAARQARMQARPGMGPGMGPGVSTGPGTGGPGMGGRGMGMNMPTFSDFDLDGSGGLTKQEFYDARAQRMRERAQQGFPMRNAPNAPPFETLDSDGDGIIGPGEFGAAQNAHRQQMMQQP